MIQIEWLRKTKFLNPDRNLEYDPHNFAPCKLGIRQQCAIYPIITLPKLCLTLDSPKLLAETDKKQTSMAHGFFLDNI